MQHGDIDNRLPPRWLIVFEGVIAELPDVHYEKAFDMYVRLHAWRRAVDIFQVNAETSKRLWDLTWRQSFKFDVATFLPEKMVPYVEKWLDRSGLPYSNLRYYESPAALGRLLALMPDVYAVVHAHEQNRFTYGDRGVLVTNGWD